MSDCSQNNSPTDFEWGILSKRGSKWDRLLLRIFFDMPLSDKVIPREDKAGVMELCFIGKYPPIEGGVSSTNYWLVRGLAQRGHKIHIVTNADEVDPAYRMLLEPDDWAWYEPEFESTGGRVRVYNPEPFNSFSMGHIPRANPFVSKLASVATDVIRNHNCEAVYAYYYEPYAVAGALAAQWTGRPLILKHAGSDLDRLFRVPDLATTYKEVLRSADLVVTQPGLMPRFLGMGVREEALTPDVRFPVPGEVFHPGAVPLNIGRLAIRSTGAPLFDASLPTIGVYGKIGAAKGTFDLIKALGILAAENLRFNFAAMIGAPQGAQISNALSEAGLLDRTFILPFLPHWKVPSFIRACTAVCFLERGFPVAIHGPVVPREVLACGTCLILSGEIAAKQINRDEFVSGENLVIADDPRDIPQLAGALRSVICDPAAAAKIGLHGASLGRTRQDDSTYAEGWEQIFLRVKKQRKAPSDKRDPLGHVASRFLAEMRNRFPLLVREFESSANGGDRAQTAIAFCNFLQDRLPTLAIKETTPLLNMLAYQRARLHSTYDSLTGGVPPFPTVDRLEGRTVSEETAGNLRPMRGALEIVDLEFDVTPFFAEIPADTDVADVDFEHLPQQNAIVLFQRTANHAPREFQINQATRELIMLCDGSRTTSEVVVEMCGGNGSDGAQQRERVLAALDRLYRANVLVFAERKEGWGWTGGTRGKVVA